MDTNSNPPDTSLLSPPSLQMSSPVHSNWLDFGADSGVLLNDKREEHDGLVGGFTDSGGFDFMEPAVKRQRLEAAAELSRPSTSYSSFTSLDVDEGELDLNDDPTMDHPFSSVENPAPTFNYDEMFAYDDDDDEPGIAGLLSSPGRYDEDDSLYSTGPLSNAVDCYSDTLNESQSNSQLATSALTDQVTSDHSLALNTTPSDADTSGQSISTLVPTDSTQENEEGEIDDDSEEEFLPDMEEIDSMLDQGMEGYSKKEKPTGDQTQQRTYVPPQEKQKVVLIERDHDPFDILPEGWLVVTHNSGMPVYLHKQTRVCTLSRPYFLGPGSARRHEIPISAIPCLQYQRALDKENCPAARGATPPDGAEQNNQSETITENGHQEETNESSNIANTGDVGASNGASSSDPKKPIGAVVVASAKQFNKENSLDSMQLREYCEKLFKFRTITVRRFQTWKDRRKHNMMLKKASRPALPSDTKLLTFPVIPDKDNVKPDRKKEFVLNPVGKTKVGILHEYVQQALRVQPKYIFKELENGKTPYSATVVINGVQYGTGYASSKKAAKMEAARASLEILIPDLDLSSPSGSPKREAPGEGGGGEDKTQPSKPKVPVAPSLEKVKVEQPKNPNNDLALFNEIKVEDPRVADLCAKAGQPSPYQILTDCLKRNYGLGDTDIHMEMHTLKHQRSEFTMRVGKHEAKVISKNKREGKHQAAQTILQKLHPHITSWGSLLRLYNWKEIFREKKEEKRTVGMLQSGSRPNKAILSKLRQEMLKLYEKKQAGMPATDDQLQVLRADVKASNLLSIDL